MTYLTSRSNLFHVAFICDIFFEKVDFFKAVETKVIILT